MHAGMTSMMSDLFVQSGGFRIFLKWMHDTVTLNEQGSAIKAISENGAMFLKISKVLISTFSKRQHISAAKELGVLKLLKKAKKFKCDNDDLDPLLAGIKELEKNWGQVWSVTAIHEVSRLPLQDSSNAHAIIGKEKPVSKVIAQTHDDDAISRGSPIRQISSCASSSEMASMLGAVAPLNTAAGEDKCGSDFDSVCGDMSNDESVYSITMPVAVVPHKEKSPGEQIPAIPTSSRLTAQSPQNMACATNSQSSEIINGDSYGGDCNGDDDIARTSTELDILADHGHSEFCAAADADADADTDFALDDQTEAETRLCDTKAESVPDECCSAPPNNVKVNCSPDKKMAPASTDDSSTAASESYLRLKVSASGAATKAMPALTSFLGGIESVCDDVYVNVT
jgi:hypothetical protein